MEKADILEYTVQYLRRIQRQEFSGGTIFFKYLSYYLFSKKKKEGNL